MNTFKQYLVTCSSSGCENENIQIEIQAEDDTPIVICGPCSNQITDIISSGE